MSLRLTTEQRIAVVKCHWRTGSIVSVQRDFRSLFNCQPPTAHTIRALATKFDTTGSIHDLPPPGRPATATSTEQRANLEASIARSPQKSSRRLSAELGVSQQSILRMLQQLKYRPYIPRLVHELCDGDQDKRVEFCEEFLQRLDEGDLDIDCVLWSDEATFKLNGTINRHNCVYWAQDNPMVTIGATAHSPGVCVWCGIWSKGIVGPFFFDGTVNAQCYLAMLQQMLGPILHQQLLHYQHDGAPAHYATSVRKWLDENLPDRWIGRRGPLEWPARSPDLTPPDFFLWGILKDRVYASRPRTIDELKDKIRAEIAAVPVELCEKVCRSVPERLRRCIEVNGEQTELS